MGVPGKMAILSDTTDGEWERQLYALGDKLSAHASHLDDDDDTTIHSSAGSDEDHDDLHDSDDLENHESTVNGNDDSKSKEDYFYTVDKWNHEIKMPETLDELISALEDVRSEIGGDKPVKAMSSGEDGIGPGRLAIDYGVDPSGAPMVMLGDRGYAPVLRNDGLATDSGLLLEQAAELVAQDYEEEERLVSDVVACALSIDSMDDVHSVAAVNRVRQEDPDLFKIASIALGLWNDGEGQYANLDEAATAALEMERR